MDRRENRTRAGGRVWDLIALSLKTPVQDREVIHKRSSKGERKRKKKKQRPKPFRGKDMLINQMTQLCREKGLVERQQELVDYSV